MDVLYNYLDGICNDKNIIHSKNGTMVTVSFAGMNKLLSYTGQYSRFKSTHGNTSTIFDN